MKSHRQSSARASARPDDGASAPIEALSRSSGSFDLTFAAVLVGLIGYGIDRWLGIVPVFTLVFSVAGFIGASASIYYRYKEQMAADHPGARAVGTNPGVER